LYRPFWFQWICKFFSMAIFSCGFKWLNKAHTWHYWDRRDCQPLTFLARLTS
jgi:hypothetical protein